MKFTGPRIAKNQDEMLQNHFEQSEIVPKISDALKAAEIALVCYANIRGELAVGKQALVKIREARGLI